MGRNWAIAIGINDYDNLQSLSYAKRDAEAVRDYFRSEIGFEQVYYFAEDAPNLVLEHGPPSSHYPPSPNSIAFSISGLSSRFSIPAITSGSSSLGMASDTAIATI